MSDLVKRLRDSEPLVICPYDRKSPEYWTAPNDAPCKFCGSLPEGPDKCTGADTRIFGEAADRIDALEAENKALREDAKRIYWAGAKDMRELLAEKMIAFGKSVHTEALPEFPARALLEKEKVS